MTDQIEEAAIFAKLLKLQPNKTTEEENSGLFTRLGAWFFALEQEDEQEAHNI